MAGELRTDRPADGVLRLTISNPGKRNALDHALLDAIAAALWGGVDARCVLLTGADGLFSSGYDIGDIDPSEFAEAAERLVAHPFTDALEALDACEVPTLAALPGPTIGGGLELALACDLRLAADGIALGMPPAKLGLVYSHTGLRRFVDAIGGPRTRELFLLGRPIDAAHGAGLGARQRRRRPRPARGARARVGGRARRQRAAEHPRDQARPARARARPLAPGSRGGGRAARAAARVLRLG